MKTLKGHISKIVNNGFLMNTISQKYSKIHTLDNQNIHFMIVKIKPLHDDANYLTNMQLLERTYKLKMPYVIFHCKTQCIR